MDPSLPRLLPFKKENMLSWSLLLSLDCGLARSSSVHNRSPAAIHMTDGHIGQPTPPIFPMKLTLS
jgi:hypothetical protein